MLLMARSLLLSSAECFEVLSCALPEGDLPVALPRELFNGSSFFIWLLWVVVAGATPRFLGDKVGLADALCMSLRLGFELYRGVSPLKLPRMPRSRWWWGPADLWVACMSEYSSDEASGFWFCSLSSVFFKLLEEAAYLEDTDCISSR